MRFKKYFRTSRFEPRLIDVISFFYIFKVLLYTSSDVKDKYPATLIVLGLIFHGIAYIVWRTEYGSKSIITSEKVKSFLYQVLPFGLTVTYSLSIREGFIRGEVSSSNIDDFMKFARDNDLQLGETFDDRRFGKQIMQKYKSKSKRVDGSVAKHYFGFKLPN